jgi:predicted ArsR family transcriptional regulator
MDPNDSGILAGLTGDSTAHGSADRRSTASGSTDRGSTAGLDALHSLGDPVRRRLYEYVAGHGAEPVGRDQAAAATGIGRPLAAYHLDKLVALGLLTASYRRPAGRGGPGAGRPAKVYARSAAEFAVTIPPREYELAARLLAVAVEADPDGGSRTALREAARQFGAGIGQRIRAADPSADGARHAEAAQAALRAHGFEPWQDEEGTIRLRNCPFHQLAAQHTEVICGMNLALIEGLVAGLGASGLSPALAPQPGCCCVVIGTCPASDGKLTGGQLSAGRETLATTYGRDFHDA